VIVVRATGLIKVLEHFHVENLWMNRPWNFVAEVVQHFHGNYSEEGLYRDMRTLHPYLIEMEAIVSRTNKNSLFQTEIHDVLQGSQIGSFRVLAPSRQRYISLIPDLPKTPKRYADSSPGLLSGLFAEAKKAVTNYIDEKWDIETLSTNPQPPTGASNESSVVQMAVVDNERFLLTGDVGPDGLNEAADYATLMELMGPLRFMQVPDHGSRHNVTPAVLDRWLGSRVTQGVERGAAYASVGTNRTEHPRAQVTNAFRRRGYPVHTMRKVAKRHQLNMGGRDGYETSVPEPFKSEVEA
jgi:hypothetical protein